MSYVRVKVFFEVDAELFPQRLKILEVFFVLVVVFNFLFDTYGEKIELASCDAKPRLFSHCFSCTRLS